MQYVIICNGVMHCTIICILLSIFLLSFVNNNEEKHFVQTYDLSELVQEITSIYWEKNLLCFLSLKRKIAQKNLLNVETAGLLINLGRICASRHFLLSY